jgi:hypothetical protein
MDKAEMNHTFLALALIVYVFTACWFYHDTKAKDRLQSKTKLMTEDYIAFVIIAACWPAVVLIGIAGDWLIRNVSHK